jgi:hypothetical protein
MGPSKIQIFLAVSLGRQNLNYIRWFFPFSHQKTYFQRFFPIGSLKLLGPLEISEFSLLPRAPDQSRHTPKLPPHAAAAWCLYEPQTGAAACTRSPPCRHRALHRFPRPAPGRPVGHRPARPPSSPPLHAATALRHSSDRPPTLSCFIPLQVCSLSFVHGIYIISVDARVPMKSICKVWIVSEC